jgi:hypothetical protein
MGRGVLYHFATSELEEQFSLYAVKALCNWGTRAAVQIWCNADAGEGLPECKWI